MVSANPNRPKGLLVSSSWSRPTARPTSSAEKEFPPKAWSTTTTRKTSTERAKPAGQICMPTKWTRAARAMAASSLRVATGVVLLQFRRHGVVVQEVDLVEGAEVDGGSELDVVEELAAALHLDHGAHRDPPRIDAVDAGGEHLVAHPHVRLQGDVVELQGAAPPAAPPHHPLSAGAQDHAADARGAVGDELHLGVGAGDGEHPPHQAVGREHRLVEAGG